MKTMGNAKRNWRAGLALWACVGLAARADLLVYEGFDYDSGNDVTIFDAGTGFGWGGTRPTWTKQSQEETRTNQQFVRVSSSWSYVDSLGNQLNTTGGVHARWYNGDLWHPWGFSSARRDFGSTINTPAGGVLWMSLLASRSTPSSNSRDVKIFLAGMPSSGCVIGRNSSGHKWGLFHYTDKDQLALDSELIVDGEPDLLVLKLSFTATTTVARLWVNPAVIGTGESGLGTADCTQTWPAASNGYTGLILGSNEAMYGYFDEIRIGDAAVDVLPFTAPPPPGTVFMIR